jgi:HPt (histidine-containing phosphotransfer) domain-containing protein
MDDLLVTFMPKFAAIAKTRVARSIDLAGQRTNDSATAIAREMHAIAGEAGLLGIANIVSLARSGEEHAKRLRTSSSDADAAALLASLDELRRAIELVTSNQKGPNE